MFTKKTTQIFAENKVVNKSRRLLSDAASLASYYLQPISTSITIFFNISDSKYREAELIVSACGHVLFILLLIVNIVFSVGVAFRHFRLLCCGECFAGYDEDVYDHYYGKEKQYDSRL